MTAIILFILGLVLGSFLNVIAVRYRPDGEIFGPKTIGGRSRCPVCHKQLSWYELVPLVSYVLLGARCRHCKHLIAVHYPLVEIFSGLALLLPFLLFERWHVQTLILGGVNTAWFLPLAGVWVVAALLLLLLALIDARWSIIPDSLNIAIAVLGAVKITIIILLNPFNGGVGSFLGSFAMIVGLADAVLLNHIVAALAGALFFTAIIIWTRGEGMGWGDVKLAAALGLLLGYPDIIFALASAFFLGALYGIFTMLTRKKTIKEAVPFGPFIVLGAVVLVLWGERFLAWYFSVFN